MEIISQGIQSYQTNQTHAGWVESTESHAIADSDVHQEPTVNEDRVSLSQSKVVFDWIAQSFPNGRQQTEDVIRLNQQLFDYQIFSLDDIQTVNRLLEGSGDASLDQHLEAALTGSTSYQERQSLSHIRQVYATLDASRQFAA